ncbi:hypothetical protein GO491_11980 [Flavobacteriaceae bacterium Ap0902]|nr:hypothetical protein [Flavobacteriaceae bacterium Ap0902]
MTTVNNVKEAVQELVHQLGSQENYLHNYRLLENIKQYVEESRKNGSDATLEEEIEMYIADDLNWEYPIEL